MFCCFAYQTGLATVGVDSLVATELANQLCDIFNIDISAETFIENPTMEGIITAVLVELLVM